MFCFSRGNLASTNLKMFSSSKLDKFTLFTQSFVGWKSLQRTRHIFFRLSWHFRREKHLLAKQELITRHFFDKTLRLVRISLLISAIQRVLRFFSGNLFYKSNRKLFFCVCIAWYKHSRRWENFRQLCKPLTSSRVWIIVSNSPNPSRVYIRLCEHGKRLPLLNSLSEKERETKSVRWVIHWRTVSDIMAAAHAKRATFWT